MFYSEELLSKTGPLARVWLASNFKHKLKKHKVIQSNIPTSALAIMDNGQVPLALRLSGQLLLGVVRLYSGQARYLLDDCNETLVKIKRAFRPGNVDLPLNQAQAVNPASLTLPDVLTELDLFAPMLDPSLLVSQAPEIEIGRHDPTLLDHPSRDPQTTQEHKPYESVPLDDPDFYLDISEGPDNTVDRSIETGRDAPPQRPASEEFAPSPKPLNDDDLDLDVTEDSILLSGKPSVADEDIAMGGMDGGFGPDDEQHHVPAPLESDGIDRRDRESVSPLSSARSSVARELEDTFHFNEGTILEPEEEYTRAPQRVKRRKILQADSTTELSKLQIRAQDDDRSKILKQPEFLPRDPMLLALMKMQKTGGFVSSILGDGRSRGWAPELRGILSLEVVRRSGALKRKRNTATTGDGVEKDQDAQAPHLEIPDESGFDLGVGPGFDACGDTTLSIGQEEEELGDVPARQRIASVEPVFQDEEEEEEQAVSPLPGTNFDDTIMPLLHPEDAGPVSDGTRHAVHLLRERFGSETESSPGARLKNSVILQDMLPEPTTTKADATKLFFECLVLATKDAVKVEQQVGQLDAPIRLRAKRGLWGAWAEASEVESVVAAQT